MAAPVGMPQGGCFRIIHGAIISPPLIINVLAVA